MSPVVAHHNGCPRQGAKRYHFQHVSGLHDVGVGDNVGNVTEIDQAVSECKYGHTGAIP
jgi:hypothetical protein